MGKLLSGHYGAPPEAESVTLSLKECNEILNVKPSDFVSGGPPAFFEKNFGAGGKYLLFLAETSDIKESSVWKEGYYLLPLEAKDVLTALEKRRKSSANEGTVLPIEWEKETEAPAQIKDQAIAWAKASQPLFFKCTCSRLALRLFPPWALRRRWKARLRCPKRCQPPLTTVL